MRERGREKEIYRKTEREKKEIEKQRERGRGRDKERDRNTQRERERERGNCEPYLKMFNLAKNTLRPKKVFIILVKS